MANPFIGSILSVHQWCVGGAIACFAYPGFLAAPASSQLIPDSTLGPESSVVTPATPVQGLPATLVEGGAVRDSNLFHSFTDFHVLEGQRVYFANPVGIENILSRVTGGVVSTIDGLLGVDGPANLFVLNPNGIIFGPNARLDVSGSFIASTGDRFQFADGSEFTAAPLGPDLLTLSVPLGVQFNDAPQGDITNSGVLAVGPNSTLTLFGNSVTTRGELIAPGGTVQVLGNQVSLVDQARVTVSGPTAGGAVFIGGDYPGQGTLPTAQQTRIEPGVRISANALEMGDGGSVIVWADGTTEFAGQILAQGGPQGGDGGFVETSGGQSLIVSPNAQVDTFAPRGQVGVWLLDPTDLTVVESGGTASIGPSGTNSGTNIPDTASTIDASVVAAAASINDVILQATNSIAVDAPVVVVGPLSDAGSITLDAPTVSLNQPITFDASTTSGRLSGTASSVNVGAGGSVQNGIDVAASGATVNVAAGTFIENAEVTLTRDVTLNGAGASETVLDGNNSHRVLKVDSETTATVSDLTISSGNVADENGAGILNYGNLTINRSTITGNTVQRDFNNVVSGGGIRNEGVLAINESVIANNQAFVSAGISNDDTLTINASTISGNIAESSGGGIYNNYGSVTISNSTISGNSAGFRGGGVRTRGRAEFSSIFSITSSLVSGNIASEGDNISNEGITTFISSGNNLFGSNGASGVSGAELDNSDLVPDEPIEAILEVTLADNDGPTPTLALVEDSPAIDAGSGEAPDQRGGAVVNDVRDIGAFEFDAVIESPITLPPVEEQPVDNPPVGEQPVGEQPVGEQPVGEQPTMTPRTPPIMPMSFTEPEAFTPSQESNDPSEEANDEVIGTPALLIAINNLSNRIQLQSLCGDTGSGDSDAQSTFTITGSGGLPAGPNSLNGADEINVPWVTRDRPSPVATITPSSPKPAAPLIEAQGLVINSEGQAMLVADALPGRTTAVSSPLARLCNVATPQ